jgi:hypothetical protein
MGSEVIKQSAVWCRLVVSAPVPQSRLLLSNRGKFHINVSHELVEGGAASFEAVDHMLDPCLFFSCVDDPKVRQASQFRGQPFDHLRGKIQTPHEKGDSWEHQHGCPRRLKPRQREWFAHINRSM